jgi:hypothetical protein
MRNDEMPPSERQTLVNLRPAWTPAGAVASVLHDFLFSIAVFFFGGKKNNYKNAQIQ